MTFHASQPNSQEDSRMSRRKQTKPLRLNEDEELQTGRRHGDSSYYSVMVLGTVGSLLSPDINCYLTGQGRHWGGGREGGAGGGA